VSRLSHDKKVFGIRFEDVVRRDFIWISGESDLLLWAATPLFEFRGDYTDDPYE